MKITRLAIKNYRGLRDLSVEVPPGGAIIAGGNARGKTSILRAIGAALGAQGIGPDAIHIGADQAEIVVDMDALRVRRSITAKGSSLTVKTAEGDTKSKPQTFLSDLFGTSSLDPLAFFLADAKERRRQVLEAIPLKVTEADVARWTAGWDGDEVTALDAHGLEVVATLRKHFYDLRTRANTEERTLKAKADAAAAEAKLQAPALAGAPDKAQAEATLAEVVAELQEVKGRAAAGERARKASESTHQKIAELRLKAGHVRAEMPPLPGLMTVAAVQQEMETAEAAVIELEARLHSARNKARDAVAAVETLAKVMNEYVVKKERATALDEQADSLEASLASIDSLAVSPEEIPAAEENLAVAKERVVRAHAAAGAEVARLHADELAEEAKAQADVAAALDKIVASLTNVAPRELADRSDMIPGLAFTDAGITLDGVTLDSLSGAEQLRFAVDLARRANAKAKILVCDGLERLDAGRLDEFVRLATAGGWQLLATKVSDGDLVLEAIEADETPARKAG